MRVGDFLKQIDGPRIVAAIQTAETSTSAEIRVFISRRHLRRKQDIVSRAATRFEKLGMTATAERNGVLLYFMPLERQFAIIGDHGIDRKCGHGFWADISEQITGDLKNGDFTEAITNAVLDIGLALARHFPRRPDDRNELSDHLAGD